ncbi:MAG TPA: hypothetical protein VGR80_10130 [Steroidobacteraceae bacterium]|nr:hypothetical protein [Gammaproteobacteria bacterium]HEV2286391.1 hypothetical protein [Steroidobacteraceae bacterium]
MAAELSPGAAVPVVRDRRPAIWPWLLMPLVVLVVFAALYRIHHRAGTPWPGLWMHPSEPGAPPAH